MPRRAAIVNTPMSPQRTAPLAPPRRVYRRPQHEVPADTVDRFAAGTASRDERGAVLRHLLTGCAHCQRRLGAFWSCPAPVDTDAYDAVFHRLAAG